MKNTILTFIYLCWGIAFAQTWQSELLNIDSQGNLVYHPDKDGFVLPDFSHAGYRGGGIDLPTVPVVKEISPVSGDNTAHIQSAIDEVAKLPVDERGLRGALLLKAGRYEVHGTLYVKSGGIILRGEGSDLSKSTSTLIYAKGNIPHQRDVILLGNPAQNKWNSKISGTQKNITTAIVPPGARSFTVTDSSPYKVGDLIAIYHPCSEAWLKAIDYGGVPAPSGGDADERWTENKYPIIYHRYITEISGNSITVDAPVFYTLNRALAQSYIYKFSATSILKEIGIEDLCIDIESDGGTDEEHAWQAVRFRSVENCWARNVTAKGFGQSGFITDCCTRTTIENCKAIEPISIITGERRYNFNTYVNSQLILFKDCYASNGRHHYVSNGTSSASGIVFLNCISDNAHSTNEGHRHWTQGMLYDNHIDVNVTRGNNPVLGLYCRGDMGTGHGWAAVQSVLWNCNVDINKGRIVLEKPPTGQNYAIGCMARTINVYNSGLIQGYTEGMNRSGLTPGSLYEAQLNARLNATGINKPEKDLSVRIELLPEIRVIRLHVAPENLPVDVNYYDIHGRLIFRKNIHSSSEELYLSDKGIGILRIENENRIFTRKICIL